MNFKDKTVIVTGAGRGIGKAIAIMYAAHGANVIIAEIDPSLSKDTCTMIKKTGGSAESAIIDVGKPDDIIKFFSELKNENRKIDIMINNAGISEFKSPYVLTVEEWDRIINTNLRGVFLCSREAALIMKENSGGSIVNIASTRAVMSEPNSEVYAASKGGIVSLTHAMAASFSADNIRVNCISPGWINTGHFGELREIDHKQHFSGRVGKPEDIGMACLYLTNPDNSFVNGINLVVDGGMTKKMIYEE